MWHDFVFTVLKTRHQLTTGELYTIIQQAIAATTTTITKQNIQQQTEKYEFLLKTWEQ